MAEDKLKPDNIIHQTTDVLVVGGGGAGVYAAVAASTRGAKTVLASAGKVGRSGNTIMVGGDLGMDGKSAFDLGEAQADPAFTKEIEFEEIICQSFFLADQSIVEQFCEYAPSCVNDLVKMGRKINAQFDFYPPGGYICNGKELGFTLIRFTKEHKDIIVHEDIRILDLISNKGRVVGALGLNIYTGEYIVYHAKAVILATGGYQPYSFKCTEASASNGDGMAMAYRIGALLRDMEFNLFIPGTFLSPKHHRGSIFGYIYAVLSNQYHLTDKNRNIIPIPESLKHINETTEMSKIIMNYNAVQAISKGLGTRNGGIYIDFAGFPPEKIKEGFNEIAKLFPDKSKKENPGSFVYSGEDFGDMMQEALKGGKWEVAGCSEYSMGGILVDNSMRTTVPGLYAAGETTSGCFGAIRIADGLTEMLVQGRKAGESAVEDILKLDQVYFDANFANGLIQKYEELLNKKEDISPSRARKQLQQIADLGFGLYRDGESMEKALAQLGEFKQQVQEGFYITTSTRAYNFEFSEVISVLNLLICLEAGLRAALLRTESRGNHIRLDYPEVNHDEWLVNLVIRRGDQGMAIEKRIPNMAKIPPPTGIHKDLMAYVEELETKFGKLDNWTPNSDKIGGRGD